MLAKKLNRLIEKLSAILSQSTSVAEDVANSKASLEDISEGTKVVIHNMNRIMEGLHILLMELQKK